MKIKITKANIEKIKQLPNGIYRDSELIGFAVRVMNTKQTYIIDKKFNNRVVRKVIGNVGTLTPDEARKEAIKLLAELAKGIDVIAEKKKDQAKSVTLKQAYDDYKRIKRLRDTTQAGYDSAFNTVFKDWLDVEIKKINRDMIENKFKTYSKDKPIATNLYFRALKAVFNFAIEKYCIDGEPVIPSNPCNRLNVFKMWNEMKPRDRYVKPAQIKMFYYGVTPDEVDTPYIKAVKNQCKFILFTGLRDQEAACLRRKDIDFDEKTITVEDTKNHHRHILPFGEWLGGFLSELCKGKKQNDYIFASGNKHGHLKDHRKAVRQISKDCGVAFSLHDLRRTFASIVANDLPFVVSEYHQQRLLNHIPQDVHSKHYVQFADEALRKPMQAVEDYILAQAGIKEPVKDNKVVDIKDIRKDA
jgi:integrase